MGIINQASSRRHAGGWKIRDIVAAAFLGGVIALFFVLERPWGGGVTTSLVESSIETCPFEYVDHMPCEDPKINSHISRDMNFYRERHCPNPHHSPLCLIPPPTGYRISVNWPQSLDKIWHDNMPYNKIADRKGHQGWMKREGPYFIFPGGGTMFPGGATQYIDKLKQYIPGIAGKSIRTALDMGCGVASFGGYMLAEGVLTLSFAPRDSHKAQIQFALERGIPAFVAMLGTRRLPFPAFSFDLIHCSRCLIPYTAYNATYFMEVDRLLRPGGYIVISGPPVQWPKQEKEWDDLQTVAKSLCYESLAVDGNTAIWRKPNGDSCLPSENEFGLELCDVSDDPSDAWYIKMKKCVTRTNAVRGDVAVGSIKKWPQRLTKAPSRVSVVDNGFDVFESDTKLWTRRVEYYKKTLKLKLGAPSVRNIMDMNAFFGGFAASLASDPVWVMNVVPAGHPSTLAVVYDRGLIGLYHDWCEPFSTYPRTYDFIHVGSVESLIKDPSSGKSRCKLVDVMVEIDRILRPEGTVVFRDSQGVIDEVHRIARAVRWTSTIHEKEPGSHGAEKVLIAMKKLWKLPSASH
ncbi:methyltransferase [Lithospermum erythrorhizon]|uniref:Methyltransferase n=1 Tax=Lithospermum erythrorhizon TaxID=34254 RepID=A0AAV3PA76_LITER